MATPETDAKERETEKCDAKMHAHYGWKFARRLETERDALAAALRNLIERVDLQGGLGEYKGGVPFVMQSARAALSALDKS